MSDHFLVLNLDLRSHYWNVVYDDGDDDDGHEGFVSEGSQGDPEPQYFVTENQEARSGLARFDGETLTDRLCTLAESSLKLSNADEFSS